MVVHPAPDLRGSGGARRLTRVTTQAHYAGLVPATTTDEAVVAAWRAESARLVGALTRMTRDVALAEDLAQDALVAALEQWPAAGVPDNPGAWLMTIAKRRGIDHFRRTDRHDRKVAELQHAAGEEGPMPDLDDLVDHIEDDVLRLMFLSCHPSLTPESRAALTLRLVGGLTTAEIARGFLTTEATMGQRISRAKKTLATTHAEFELPTGEERVRRLDDVMAVVYLIFNEGYTATAGADWMRPELATEAMRLARMLAALAPDEPEVLGLQALLEIQGSRMPARLDDAGEPVLLEDQDRSRWDQLLVRRGLAALGRAEQLAARGVPVGRYFLQASIAAQHARAVRAEDTDWRRIAGLYDVLAERGTRTGGRGQPGGRARPRLRTRRRPRRPGRRRPDRPRTLTAGGERARRPARAGGASRRGRRGLHRRGDPGRERRRARHPHASRGHQPVPRRPGRGQTPSLTSKIWSATRAVGLAVHGVGRLGVGRLDETEDLPLRLVDPVAQVADPVGSLRREVGLVRLGDVVHGDAVPERVEVHVERHCFVLPEW